MPINRINNKVDVADMTKRLTVKVKVKGIRRFVIRSQVAMWLFNMGGKLLGVKGVEVEFVWDKPKEEAEDSRIIRI